MRWREEQSEYRRWRRSRPWLDGEEPGAWGPRRWHRRGRHLFARFALTFGIMAVLVLGGMSALAFLLTHLFGGNRPTAVLVWLVGVGLAVAFPVLALRLAVRAFHHIALPLGDIMAAADAVASGDLAARVAVRGQGDFTPLARSFNRMAEELQRADRQRRDLTADVAHELRTPLHIIQGNLEGILDGVYVPDREHIEATLAETRALARLVDDLRTLSLAEAGQLPLTLEQANVAELLEDVETSFSGQAEAAGIALRVRAEGSQESLTISADPGRLEQVLSNLLGNALRHTPGGGTIELRAEPLSEASSAPGVRITVSDTGEGIAAEDLPRIFDRFWRADHSRSHAGGAGSGLGLAIARQLVQAHGGRIGVVSEQGHGTTFTIDLPKEPRLQDVTLQSD